MNTEFVRKKTQTRRRRLSRTRIILYLITCSATLLFNSILLLSEVTRRLKKPQTLFGKKK